MIATQHVTWAAIFRHDIAPVVSGYAVFAATLLAYARRLKVARPGVGGRPGKTGPPSELKMRLTVREPGPLSNPHARRPFLRYLAATFLGGFGVFLLIVVVFYFVIGSMASTLIRQAIVQGSLFAFGIVLPSFLLLSFLEDRVQRARTRRQAGTDAV